MNQTVLITVSNETNFENLHEYDTQIAGNYAILISDDEKPEVGCYASNYENEEEAEGEDPIEKTALDHFHDQYAIKVLDDFSIETMILGNDEELPENVIWI